MKRHDRAFLQSVDLNTDASLGSQLDEDYDAGWPSSSSGLWSAKGPTVYAPRMGLARSAKLHVQWALGGWSDANQWKRAMKLVRMYVYYSPRSSELRLGLVKGLLLSGVVCALVYFFSLTLLPEFRGAEEEEETHAVWVGSVSSTFWLYPLIAGSYLVASTWTLGVAEAAFSAQNLHVPEMHERLQHTSWVEHVSRAVLIANYSLVCLALQYLPWIGPILAFLIMSLVDGYFCFEQVWVRLRFSESHWSYLIGFGVPSTAVSFFHPSGLLNLMLFMLVFPMCTVLALLAEPMPTSSSLGSQATMLPTGPHHDRSKELSALLPARIPLFWPTVRVRRVLLAFAPRVTPLSTGSHPAPKKYDRPGMPPRMPRQSAAQFVGGAWTGSRVGSPSPSATPAPVPTATAGSAAPWLASSVSIPMASDQGSLGARKSHKTQ
ncbi:hypothetical protein MBRA1_002359 [Malassezia brasiliensis]|uniref:Etoposide-induced protein 2.4 n=1 Tax=Malassezia brasiliensis TaxID=1821822 RepID=A0AAF0DU10_9BASI|nr:hypothetical protein MBRA1_002359 [Malassezia brasiliensis]